jgi:hypothetical protein
MEGAMKAVLFAAHGGPEVLDLDEAPDPVAGAGEVVVESRRRLITSRAWRLSQPWAHIIFQAD